MPGVSLHGHALARRSSCTWAPGSNCAAWCPFLCDSMLGAGLSGPIIAPRGAPGRLVGAPGATRARFLQFGPITSNSPDLSIRLTCGFVAHGRPGGGVYSGDDSKTAIFAHDSEPADSAVVWCRCSRAGSACSPTASSCPHTVRHALRGLTRSLHKSMTRVSEPTPPRGEGVYCPPDTDDEQMSKGDGSWHMRSLMWAA